MNLTASLEVCSQTLADSIKRNIIEVGMRYDSLRKNYATALEELAQREAEINQLHRVLDTERVAANAKQDFLNQSIEIKDKAITQALGKLRSMQKKKFVVGPYVGYGITNQSLGVSFGVGLTYSYFRSKISSSPRSAMPRLLPAAWHGRITLYKTPC